MTNASASGKIILFGEHAVVYGRPALAVPLPQLRTRVRIEETGTGSIIVHARDLGRTWALNAAPDDPLGAIIRLTLAALAAPTPLSLDIWIESDIPIASGLGSGAAVSTAIVRALAAHLKHPLSPAEVSALVYESEKLYHGTPSGIDNTVIALEQAIRFTRPAGPQPIEIARPFTLAIANTGIASPTRITVGDVRKGWQQDPARYERLFDQVAVVVEQARVALAEGNIEQLGGLMNRNQELLQEIGVSSPEIERLAQAARAAGAPGAKLSGGGRGGNVIVYITPEQAPVVQAALVKAGAVSVIVTAVQ
ncbi:MAG: mevalonate kinase [Anaerolineae bacterium]